MKTLWRIPDFLDLEYFFIQDNILAEEEGVTVLKERDRKLYLDAIAPTLDKTVEHDREWLIYRWLQERRSIENASSGGQALLPGRMWYEIYGLFWSLFSFLAMASGAGLAWSFLSYSGKQPVNVSLFFLVFVGLQVCFLMALLLLWVYRRIRGFGLRSSLLLSLVNRGLSGVLFKVRKYGLDSMASTKRVQFAEALAAVRIRGSGYGDLFYWPLFLLFQLFGIAFNFGVLGVLLVKVASSDLAFGWQSTIQLSSVFVADLVRWVSLPWSWVLGPGSYPDPEQVAGSRMILKDGFYHLVNSDLVSWWPFLCLAICCYCLLPRIFLFVAGTMGRKRSLARITFRRPDHNQLLHRLLSPRLETTKKEDAKQEDVRSATMPVGLKQAESNGGVPDVSESVSHPGDAVNGALVALIPDELFTDCDPAELGSYCQKACGYLVSGTMRVDGGYAENGEFTARLQELLLKHNCAALLLLQEAWQPPINELLRFLKTLRDCCDKEMTIIVGLVGKPTSETLFTRATDTDLSIWRQKTVTLEDPCLQVLLLVEI